MQGSYEKADDLSLVKAVMEKKPGAWEAFVYRTGNLIHTLCALVFPESDIETECLHIFRVLGAEGYTLLRAFDGRAALSTYLTIKLTDLLAERILTLFYHDDNRAWQVFERFFRKDLLQIIAKYFPTRGTEHVDGNMPEDHYQEICLLMIEHGYRRIKAYNGEGSFAGYIRHVVRHLCIDLLRKERGRRRLPEGIKQIALLEQQVYKLLYWEGYDEEVTQGILRTQGYTPEQVTQAISRVREIGGLMAMQPKRPSMVSPPDTGTDSSTNQGVFSDLSGDPEKVMIDSEEEATQEKKLTLIQEAVTQLPAPVQLYIRLRFFTSPQKPPREIARLMGRSEAEVYKFRHQAFAYLKAHLKARGM